MNKQMHNMVELTNFDNDVLTFTFDGHQIVANNVDEAKFSTLAKLLYLLAFNESNDTPQMLIDFDEILFDNNDERVAKEFFKYAFDELAKENKVVDLQTGKVTVNE